MPHTHAKVEAFACVVLRSGFFTACGHSGAGAEAQRGSFQLTAVTDIFKTKQEAFGRGDSESEI